MTRPLQVLRAYSIAEIRATPHAEALHVEYILLPDKDRWLWHPESSEADDGVSILALDAAAECRCCDGRGRFKRKVVASVSGGGGGGVTDHGALTGLGDNDHPQYTTDAEAEVIADASAAAAVAAHEAAVDPHPQYTTAAEVGTLIAAAISGLASEAYVDAAIAALTAYIDAELAAHEAALNPHPQYTTDAEVEAIVDSKISSSRSILICLTD